MTQIIDISRILASDTAVWPGDTPFNLDTIMAKKQGDSVNLTTLTVSAHTGSHADAPYHFDDAGLTIEALALDPYWGPAQVVTVQRESGPLAPADFASYDLTLAPRILVRTPAGRHPYTVFPHDFPYPSPELAGWLGSLGILLYGTDAFSMDELNSTTLPGHHAMLRSGIAIIEGLDLSHAPDGVYELAALPLKIAGGDGSPVRAALRTLR